MLLAVLPRAGAATASSTADEVVAEGRLEVVVEDHKQRRAVVRHFLRASGSRMELELKPKHARSSVAVSGTRVRVKGYREGRKVHVESLSRVMRDGTVIAAESAPAAALPYTLGEQRTLVLLLNFQDAPDNRPWSDAQVRDMFFGTVSGFYRENSFGQTWLAGDVHGWYTVPYSSTECPQLADIASAAASAAGNAGVDVSAYTRLVYLTPYNSACVFTGTADVGGNPSRAWINGKFTLHNIAHEVGHSFGLMHSHAWECDGGTSTLGGSCQNVEYGDSYDNMGSPDAGHYNNFQKSRLGWLDAGASPVTRTVTSDGAYSLSPYEVDDGTPKALKILRSVDATTGARSWFSVEYRTATGADAFLAARSNRLCRGDVTRGVVIRTATDGDANSSRVLYMKPSSCFVQTYGYADWKDPALGVGSSFTDPATGITITTLAAGNGSATVDIALTSSACTHADPTLTITPPADASAAAGTALTYGVTVRNEDGTGCGASPFTLSTNVPADWTASLSDASLTLSPGQTGSATLVVTSSGGASAGSYPVWITAANADATGVAATRETAYAVTASAEHAPVAVNDASTTPYQTAVTIPVLANDADPDGDTLTVTSVGAPGKGRVIVNANGTLTYTPRSKMQGLDTFTYVVSDGQSQATATVQVTIEAPRKRSR
ncbi:MAG TPA: Ig-like domain-containing protein [Nevskiaceae bacterium]|nr:Ig-like domain-containing protein [Nevskiaceae bacterium]